MKMCRVVERQLSEPNNIRCERKALALRRLAIWLCTLWLSLGIHDCQSVNAKTRGMDAGSASLRIIYTCDTNGYLEPCGCGGRNNGGLARRVSLIRSLMSERDGAVVESGNLMSAVLSPMQRNPRMLDVITQALGTAGYDAVGVGNNDLPYGQTYYDALLYNHIVPLKVGCREYANAERYMVKQIGVIRIGVLSFSALDEIAIDGLSLARTRYATYVNVRDASDILVLLDQSGTATNTWIERVTKRFGAPDIVVGGADRLPRNEPEMVGQTMVVPTGSQGLFVGCVDVQLDSHGQKKMTYTRHLVDPKVEKDPKVQALVDKYYSGELDTKPVAPAKKPYFPYTGCADCHKREYAQWQKSPHAGALVTLRKADRAVPSCLKCHSERYRTLDNLAIGQDDLQAVECASCHSDVLPHDSKPAQPKTDMKTKCLSCHNQERSQNFDYDKYIKLVSHKRK